MNYKLQENNAGGLLLTATSEGETLMLHSYDWGVISDYLHLAMSGADLYTLQDAAQFTDEIDEHDHDDYIAEWAECPVIADNNGVYRERACVAGKKAIQLAMLREEPLAELERCETAAEIAELVSAQDELVAPEPYGSSRYERHELAWKICRLMWDKMQPSTTEALSTLVDLWQEVCRAMVNADTLTLRVSEGEPVELYADGVSLWGFKQFDLADRLAGLCESVLGAVTHGERDEEQEWYTFKK